MIDWDQWRAQQRRAKFIANVASIALVLVGFFAMHVDVFHPNWFGVMASLALGALVCRYLTNTLMPYQRRPSSPSFGRQDNRVRRRLMFATFLVFAYFGLAHLASPLVVDWLYEDGVYPAEVVNWNPEGRKFGRRRIGSRSRCTRVTAKVDFPGRSEVVSVCFSGTPRYRIATGTAIAVRATDSPLGVLVTAVGH